MEQSLTTTGAEQLLGTGSLEKLRANILANVEADRQLSRRQKKQVMRELDFLIEYERLRRVQTLVHEYQTTEIEFRCRMREKVGELANRLRVKRAEADAAVEKLRCEAFSYRLQVVERVLQVRKRQQALSPTDKVEKEILALAMNQKVADKKTDMLHSQIARRAVNRARFREMAEREFPDSTDELMESYDQQLYQEGEDN